MSRSGTLIAVVFAIVFTLSTSAHASPTQESIFQDDDLLIHVSPAEVDRTMAELRGLGVDRVRLSAIWRDMAPAQPPADATDPAAYDQRKLAHLDAAIRAAGAHGIGVLLNVRGGVPDWAMGKPIPKKFAGRDAYRPDPGRYRQFVEMLGRRYSGQYEGLPRVDTWSLWNEPNWGGLLQPQTLRNRKTRRLYTVSPAIYRALHRAGTAALAATGHGSDRILLGETAPVGNDKLGELSHLKPVRFLQDLFCLDARLRPLKGRRAKAVRCDYDKAGPLVATGYAHHSYSVTEAPTVPSPDRGFIRIADTQRLKRILDAAAAAGRIPQSLSIWFTEYGYQTRPDPYRGIGLDQHAAWLVAAEHLTWSDPRIAAHAQFLLQDDEPRTAFGSGDPRHWATYQSGLKFADGAPKPAYEAYRLPLYAPRGLQPGQPMPLWGLVRPGINGQPQYVRVEFRTNDREGWVSVAELATDAFGYFQATIPQARSGQYRFQWLRPEQPADPVPPSEESSDIVGITG